METTRALKKESQIRSNCEAVEEAEVRENFEDNKYIVVIPFKRGSESLVIDGKLTIYECQEYQDGIFQNPPVVLKLTNSVLGALSGINHSRDLNGEIKFYEVDYNKFDIVESQKVPL